MPTFEETARGYKNLWAKAVILADKKPMAQRIALKIIGNKERYRAIEAQTGVPWFWIGPVHVRESNMSFSRHLHNGDLLTARTVRVPPGRPASGSPPFSFEESAIDALTMAPHSLHRIKTWTVERCLYEHERYNGFGYTNPPGNSPAINAPYVWAWTNLQQRGKFVADGRYDPNHWDEQPGTAALLKTMAELDVDVNARLGGVVVPPRPPELVLDLTELKEQLQLISTASQTAAALVEKLEKEQTVH